MSVHEPITESDDSTQPAVPPAPEPWQQTACILCECNCGIEVRLGGEDGRRFERIRGDKAHPASAGYTCEKALRLDHYQNGRHRLTSPLRRRADGTFEEIDWDTAISEVAARLAHVRDTWGGEAIFYYGGGGQGNHLGGGYSGALRGALGATYRSNALAQEKTGEAFVDARLYGGHTRGDFEETEVAVFLGKNPWMSHSIPRTRPTLKAIAADPGRSMIVLDPRRTETADLADHFLQVRPGTDAWAIAAMVATLVQEDLVDRAFLAEHTHGADEVMAHFVAIDIERYSAWAGLDPDDVRAAARRLAAAKSVSVFEDLGVQQSIHSTLVSYIEKMLWILTGNYAKPGAMAVHTSLIPLSGSDKSGNGSSGGARTPVAGERLISGLVPCNIIADEILTDHPARYRAMIVESGNPAHSLADSPRFREALDALDTVVVIDVAMTETARHADYVLPAASQFEKWEATFFNLEFPKNTFHLRAPLCDPLPGTLPEPEIHARLVRALGAYTDEDISPLREAAQRSRLDFGTAFLTALGQHPEWGKVAPTLLYETLGPTLPDGAASAALLWYACHRCAQTSPDAIRRAGFAGDDPLALAEALFDGVLSSRSGVVFSVDEWSDAWDHVKRPDSKFTLVIDELLEDVDGLAEGPSTFTSDAFPLVVSAGERRAFTANTIFRDPTWRKKDAGGALRLSSADAARYGLVDGGRARVTTARGSAEVGVTVDDSYQPGHAALPNGLGLDERDDDGTLVRTGLAPNDLTSSGHRDPIAGTPFHKHVPARVEPA